MWRPIPLHEDCRVVWAVIEEEFRKAGFCLSKEDAIEQLLGEGLRKGRDYKASSVEG